MAKQLKAIKCPQCGSTDKTELKSDHFRCNNCNTEYFLDNDDVTIRHKVEGVQAIPPQVKKLLLLGAAALVGIWLLTSIIGWLLPEKAPTQTFEQPPKRVEAEPQARWDSKQVGVYISPAGQPVVVAFGNRKWGRQMGEEDPRNGLYAVFFDPTAGKELKAIKLPATASSVGHGDYESFTFKNGDLYFILEDTRIYKVDRSSMSFTEVTQSMFTRHPELTSGIAKVEVFHNNGSDGFKLLTNEGAKFNYYLLQDRLYTEKQDRDVEMALENRVAGEKTIVKFDFSSKSDDYPEEKKQLLRYTMRDAEGGPDDEPRFEWRKHDSYGGPAGKFIFVFRNHQRMVRSWKDLTPGRQYFGTNILYTDAEVVLLLISNTPAENSVKSLQCLNAETGEILFTLPLGTGYHLRDALRYKDGFAIENAGNVLLVSNAGKLLANFKVE